MLICKHLEIYTKTISRIRLCDYKPGPEWVELDGPDGWSRQKALLIKRRQQAEGHHRHHNMDCIYSDKLIAPYIVDDRVKLTSQSYCEFLDKTFFR